ncbi:MAG: radical SAM protein [Nitrospinota bacterium]|nr:radical SAM protein [Nitrospinota bacterium]
MTDNAQQAPWIVSEPDSTDKRFVIVHNTFTTKTFRLNKKEVGQPLGAGISGKMRDFLLVEKLIVDPAQVTPMLERRLFEIMNSYPSNAADAVLMPTYDCQLNCEYCFNVNLRQAPSKKRLPPEKIAAKLIKFFKGTPAQMWRLRVTGGGEPTLETDYVARIAGLVRQEAEKQGRFYELWMVSNGVDLKGALLKKLLKAGLCLVQVTLDPDHDNKRVYKDGRPTLDIILKNIMALPPEVRVTGVSNVRRGEEAKFKKLLKKIRPYRHRLYDFSPGMVVTKLPERVVERGNKKMSRLNGPKEMDTMLACFDAVDEAGFTRRNKLTRVTCEAFVNSENFFINFMGQTAICPALEAVPKYHEGSRSQEDLKKEFDYRVVNPQWKDHCYDDGVPCPYLPACFGGCRMISVSQGAGWGVINCERYCFDRIYQHELSKA